MGRRIHRHRFRTTYYIRKQIGGKRYDVSTGAHSETAAHKQLVRFDAHRKRTIRVAT